MACTFIIQCASDNIDTKSGKFKSQFALNIKKRYHLDDYTMGSIIVLAPLSP